MSPSRLMCACSECRTIKAHDDAAQPDRPALEAVLDDLQATVRMLWEVGGYMTPEQQVALRSAMATLAAHGRKAAT